MKKEETTRVSIKRVGGYLHKITHLMDETGNVIHTVISPFMVELKPWDILQIIVGASILAIPIWLTEEIWILGKELPFKNVVMLATISILFLAGFIYYNFYRFHFKEHLREYFKRVIWTYILSLIVVAVLLTIIQKCP